MKNQDNLKSICYSKDFLNEVIVRLDLVSPIEAIQSGLSKKISNLALKNFPISETSKSIGQELRFSQEGITPSRKIEFTEWNFHGKEREKSLKISPGAIYITYKKYKRYEDLRTEFIGIVNTFFKEYPEAQGSRLGLRYINEIKLKEKQALDWEKYINNNLLGIFNFIDDESKLSRIFHTIEYNYGDFNLRFQFGMHNPDYPVAIVKKNFVLDYDAYYQGLQEKEDIEKNLDKFHNRIQTLFESSIKKDLRSIMNE